MAFKIDLIGKVQAEADQIVRVDQTYPDLHVLAGDYAFVKTADTASTGALIIAVIDGQHAIRRYDGEFEVYGLVIATLRGHA